MNNIFRIISKNMIKGFIYRVLALMKKEFITIWNDPKSRGIIIMMPIMQLLIFSNAVTMEVKNIDTVVLDRSNSVESRELLSRFENSSRFRKFYYAENEKEFQKYLDTQKVQIGINIPNDFSRNIKSKKGANILVVSDGRQTNSASIAVGYASQIIAGYATNEITPPQPSPTGEGEQLNKFRMPPQPSPTREGEQLNEPPKPSLTEEGISYTKAQINPTVRNWFNPNLEYKWYILTVIVALLSLVSTLILTALSIARERELGTFDQLIVSPLSSFEILLGKSIPPLIIAMSLTMIMVGIVIVFFHVPFNGSIILFFVSILISLMAIVGVGLYISAVCNTQQQAILSVMTFMMPAVLLSGFISPIEDMPLCWQYLTYLNPVRFFMVLSRGVFLKGMGIEDVIINLIPLIIIAAITLTLASRTFKRKLG